MTSDKYMRPSAVRTLHQGKERTVDKEVHTGKKNVRHAAVILNMRRSEAREMSL